MPHHIIIQARTMIKFNMNISDDVDLCFNKGMYQWQSQTGLATVAFGEVESVLKPWIHAMVKRAISSHPKDGAKWREYWITFGDDTEIKAWLNISL